MRYRMAIAALAVSVSWACASSGSTSTGGSSAGVSGGGTRSTSRNPDFIGQEEIAAQASDAANALQIIQKLRPRMLASRGLGSPNDATGETTRPKVYVDEISYGDMASLENISAVQVKQIQFLKAADATTRWGTGHLGGVILVTTKR